jgi:hypothetical protein
LEERKPPLLDVLGVLGFDVEYRGGPLNPDHPGWQRLMECPLCGAGNRKCAVHLSENNWRCFGCQQGGDVIKLVMLVKDCRFTEARAWIRRGYTDEKGLWYKGHAYRFET